MGGIHYVWRYSLNCIEIYRIILIEELQPKTYFSDDEIETAGENNE